MLLLISLRFAMSENQRRLTRARFFEVPYSDSSIEVPSSPNAFIGDPCLNDTHQWIPAFAGMTINIHAFVVNCFKSDRFP